MDFEASEFLFKSFKSGVSSLSYSPWAPRDGSPADFQSQFLWALSFPVQVPQAGKPDVGPGPLLLRGTSAVVISLLFVGCPTQEWGGGHWFSLDQDSTPPTFLNVAFSLYP